MNVMPTTTSSSKVVQTSKTTHEAMVIILQINKKTSARHVNETPVSSTTENFSYLWYMYEVGTKKVHFVILEHRTRFSMNAMGVSQLAAT
jgi:hypothetical protein